MIVLKTGVPGGGKTLTAVDEFAILAANEAFARPVYVHGIPELNLPYIPLPVFNPVVEINKRDAGFSRRMEVDWDSVTSGSLVIIDEAQLLFPVRSAGAAVPSYVAFLNVHRHRGIDLVLITQHPRLIDTAVRKLVGKHQHYRRILGMQRHICYEWDSCSESISNLKTATFSQNAFPKRAYSAYKSAEIHTKQKFAVPYIVVLPFIILAMFGYVGWQFWGYYKQGGISSVGGLKGVSSGGSTPGVPSQLPAQAPALPGLSTQYPTHTVASSASAPILGATPGIAVGEGYYRVRNTWPAAIAGCWLVGEVCKCAINESAPRIVEIPQLCGPIVAGILGPSPLRPEPTVYKAVQPVIEGQNLPLDSPAKQTGPVAPPVPSLQPT